MTKISKKKEELKRVKLIVKENNEKLEELQKELEKIVRSDLNGLFS